MGNSKKITLMIGKREIVVTKEFDSSDADAMFSKIVELMLGCDIPKRFDTVIDTNPKISIKPPTSSIAEEIKRRQRLINTFADKTVIQVKDVYKAPSLEAQSPRPTLIFTKCSCGKIQYMVATPNDTKYCNCGEVLKLEDIHPGHYICPNCTHSARFSVCKNVGNVLETKCKMCESPIDMEYHEKKSKYLSDNMYDRK